MLFSSYLLFTDAIINLFTGADVLLRSLFCVLFGRQPASLHTEWCIVLGLRLMFAAVMMGVGFAHYNNDYDMDD